MFLHLFSSKKQFFIYFITKNTANIYQIKEQIINTYIYKKKHEIKHDKHSRNIHNLKKGTFLYYYFITNRLATHNIDDKDLLDP